MSNRPDWTSWVLEKNAKAKEEELRKSDSVVLEKAQILAGPGHAKPPGTMLANKPSPDVGKRPKLGLQGAAKHKDKSIGGHHVEAIHSGLSALGHKGHTVEKSPHSNGVHVTFHHDDQGNHEGHLHHVLSHHGIKHGGISQNDDDEMGHEHFIHSPQKESKAKS